MLQTDYEEREKTYKQLKAMVAEAIKDLAKEEKKQVSLEEKIKHAKTKTKKLKKTISEVRLNGSALEFNSLIESQEEHSHAEAERSIEENEAKAQREAKKVQEHEKALAKEEKALEEIQESLKGIHFTVLCIPATESLWQTKPVLSTTRSRSSRRSCNPGLSRSTRSRPI